MSELKDVELCAISIEKAGDKLSPTTNHLLRLLGGLRRWCFLPAIVTSCVQLVLFKGGDALNVCFNTIAVLFMMEIDNFAYVVGLSEPVRTNVEVRGRVELDSDRINALRRAKLAHVVCIPIVVVFAVWSAPWFLGPFSMFLVQPAFLLAGQFEHFDRTLATAIYVTARWGLGFFAFFFILINIVD